MDTIFEQLLRHPLLVTLSEEEISELRAHVRSRQIRVGECIFEQGDAPDFFYFVVAGEFEVLMATDGQPLTRVNLLYPGDFFGDVSFLSGQPRGVSVRAIEESELLYITGEEFLRLYDEFPGFAERLAQLGERMESRSVLSFDGQQEGEVVLHMGRRHWMALIRQMIPAFTVGASWLVVVWLVAAIVRENTDAVVQTWLWSIPGFILAIIVGIWNYLDWWTDYHIFTNRRVILVERTIGFFERRFETSLDKIQSIRVDTPNPVETWLGFGTMVIATAAQSNKSIMRLDYLPDPDTIAGQILVELNRAKKSAINENREMKRRAVLNAIGEDPAPETPVAEAPTIPPAPPSRIPPWLRYFMPLTREQRGKMIIWRKHPIILFSDSWPAWVAFGASLYLIFAIPEWVSLRGDASWWWGGGSIVWMAVMVFWLWWNYEDWRNDRYVLTEDTITDEDVKPFGFYREVRRAPLDSIQDIRYEQTNPLDLLFNVGKVLIQTAGQEGQFTFDWVERPARVQADINRYVQVRKEARERQEAEGFRQEVLDLINIYDEHRRGRAPSSRPAPVVVPPPHPVDPDDPDATRRTDLM